MDHNGKDANSYLLKHDIEKNINVFKIKTLLFLASGFWNNIVKRKISEELWIKDLRPNLKRQEKSIKLKLFN